MSQDRALLTEEEMRHSSVTQYNNGEINLSRLARKLKVSRVGTFHAVYSTYSRTLLPFSERHWRPPEDSCIYQSLAESLMSWNVHQSRMRLHIGVLALFHVIITEFGSGMYSEL